MYVDVFRQKNKLSYAFVRASEKKYIRFFFLGFLSLSLANGGSHKVNNLHVLYINTAWVFRSN